MGRPGTDVALDALVRPPFARVLGRGRFAVYDAWRCRVVSYKNVLSGDLADHAPRGRAAWAANDSQHSMALRSLCSPSNWRSADNGRRDERAHL
jgi:hypothetical protein